jgi:hypothetical protein
MCDDANQLSLCYFHAYHVYNKIFTKCIVFISGTEIESLVYAVDLIGHKSKITKSNGIIIDTTHPEPTIMMLYGVHLVTCGNHNISIIGTALLGRCKSRSMRKRHR